ncbi:MAG: hypothetical protein AUK44_02155 [Porphyromonadaceae bacterium CG2_30_38_12]|nr:MAG: hypothetical protein AUK44_02155 [Porphyromonadaceae bacterium CG2_30_38_12]
MDETVEALRAGSHKTFSALFESYYEALCRYAFAILNDTHNAEDIVQRVFCKLWDQHESLEIRTSLKSYLYRVVHNESLNFAHQHRNREQINYEIAVSQGEYYEQVYEQIAASDLQRSIDMSIKLLPDQCRKVFEMSRIEQKSYSEIAKQLNISVNTVENHISKALRLLRIALKDYLVVFFSIFILK